MTAPFFTPRRKPRTLPLPATDGMGHPITWRHGPLGLTSTTHPREDELPQPPKQCVRCFVHLADEDRADGRCPRCQPPDPARDLRMAESRINARYDRLERRIAELQQLIEKRVK